MGIHSITPQGNGVLDVCLYNQQLAHSGNSRAWSTSQLHHVQGQMWPPSRLQHKSHIEYCLIQALGVCPDGILSTS